MTNILSQCPIHLTVVIYGIMDQLRICYILIELLVCGFPTILFELKWFSNFEKYFIKGQTNGILREFKVALLSKQLN